MDGFQEGLVESTLGADKKPVYRGGPQCLGLLSILLALPTRLSSKESFDQWFNDVPGVNRRVDFKMLGRNYQASAI